MSDGGKGSVQRPTDKQKFDEAFERIFGKKNEPKSLERVREVPETENKEGKLQQQS